MSTCPWCGCDELGKSNKPPYGVLRKPQYRDWGCGSYQRGDQPTQSVNCELNVMEAERDELLAFIERWADISRSGNYYHEAVAILAKHKGGE